SRHLLSMLSLVTLELLRVGGHVLLIAQLDVLAGVFFVPDLERDVARPRSITYLHRVATRLRLEINAHYGNPLTIAIVHDHDRRTLIRHPWRRDCRTQAHHRHTTRYRLMQCSRDVAPLRCPRRRHERQYGQYQKQTRAATPESHCHAVLPLIQISSLQTSRTPHQPYGFP